MPMSHGDQVCILWKDHDKYSFLSAHAQSEFVGQSQGKAEHHVCHCSFREEILAVLLLSKVRSDRGFARVAAQVDDWPLSWRTSQQVNVADSGH